MDQEYYLTDVTKIHPKMEHSMELSPDDLGLTEAQKSLLLEKLGGTHIDTQSAAAAAVAAAKSQEVPVSQDKAEITNPKVKVKENPKQKIL